MRPSFLVVLSVIELLILFLHGLVGALFLEVFPGLVPYQVTLGIAFFVLGFSFLIATLLTARFYTLGTRVFYYLAGAWMGFFFYFLWASMLYVAFTMVFFDGFEGISTAEFGVGVFTLAILVGCYGLFNARNLQVTKVSVTVPNLPSSWRGRSLVYISDIHLGQLYGAPFSEKIVRTINDLHPDLVCVGGDLYDGAAVPKEAVIAPFKKLSSTFGTYFITGNHEEYEDTQKYISSVKGAGMMVLDNEKVDIDGLQLMGVDYRDTVKKKAFVKILEEMLLDRTRASILLKHTPRDIDVAEAAGVSLQISGHTHKGQLFPSSLLTHSMYKGFDYGLRKWKSMMVFTSSGVGTWGPPMRVGTRSEVVHITFN